MTISVFADSPIYSSLSANRISLGTRLSGYSHTIDADGGYKSATISLPISLFEVSDWIESGLGRDIRAFGDSGSRIWEGFVNQISVSYGNLAIARGPLLDIANRVQVKYTDFTVGQAAITTAQNDTDSQTVYGIRHKVVSTGSISSTNADSIRNTYLQEYKLPELTQTLSSQPNETLLTLDCLGYVEWLDYPYNEITNTTYTLREKVLEVLGDDPNDVFSTNYANIETNTLSVFRMDTEYRLASTVLSDLIGMGGSSNNNRRLFGVYDDRICYLQEVPTTTVKYRFNLRDGHLYEQNLGDISPYSIRPGYWLEVVDFLPIQSTATELRENPSMIFIESVSYTSPYDFSINGGKTGTLTQQLAKLGLGGIS